MLSLYVLLMASTALALDPKFELDPKALEKKLPQQAPATATPTPARQTASSTSRSPQGTTYTIKAGDNLFKILMSEYGINNGQAEQLIPAIRKINGLENSKNLRVGSTIQLPPLDKLRTKSAAGAKKGGRGKERAGADSPSARLHLVSGAQGGGPVRIEKVQQVWDNLVPASSVTNGPVDVQTHSYSLTLDPDRYPVLPAADGGRIVVDSKGTLPPLVKSLITTQDPNTRVVTESPANRRRFFSSLLAAAKFYSVEEDFRVDFGVDPKLTVQADYKIEKNPDSLMRNEIVLLNVSDSRRGVPPVLGNYLHTKGFQLVDSYPAYREERHGEQHRLYQVTAREPRAIADSLLKYLAVPYDNDRSINLLGGVAGGVRLQVKADRYFERGGTRYVVSYFDGDPVQYTLMRLLEGGGYRVIMLDASDDFRRVAEKFMLRLRLPGSFAVHNLWDQRESSYGLQMSGIMLRDGKSEGKLFLTNRDIDPLIRELLEYNDYRVVRD